MWKPTRSQPAVWHSFFFISIKVEPLILILPPSGHSLHVSMSELVFDSELYLLTEHAHEDLVDPGEDADDVEGGEGNVEEEPDPHLDALVLAALPEMKYW